MGKGYQKIDESKPQVSLHSGWYITKIVFRCVSLLLCIGTIVVQITTLVDFKRKYDVITDIAYYTCPPAVLALIWDAVEFITRCARRGRGVHPGAHVGIDLILWLAGGISSGIAFGAAFKVDALIQLDSYDDGAEAELKGYSTKVKVAGALLNILAVIRFILFVRACVETHRRRKGRYFRPAAANQSVGPMHLEPMQPLPYDPVTAMPHHHPHVQRPQQYQYGPPQPQWGA